MFSCPPLSIFLFRSFQLPSPKTSFPLLAPYPLAHFAGENSLATSSPFPFHSFNVHAMSCGQSPAVRAVTDTADVLQDEILEAVRALAGLGTAKQVRLHLSRAQSQRQRNREAGSNCIMMDR